MNFNLANTVTAWLDLRVLMIVVTVAMMMVEQAVTMIVTALGIENQPMLTAAVMQTAILNLFPLMSAVVPTIIGMGLMAAAMPAAASGVTASTALPGVAQSAGTENQGRTEQCNKYETCHELPPANQFRCTHFK
jgi:hypothetical protein